MVLPPLDKSYSRCTAFTVSELLVGASVFAILAALILPTVSRSGKSALEAKSFSNLRQVVVLVNSYVTDNDGVYPPDTDPAYCHRLYPYLKPDEPALPAAESNQKLAGSVFVSPGMTMDILRKYGFQNSFSGQYVIRQVYGFNGNLDEDIKSRPTRLESPPNTCLLMSTLGPRADFSSNAVGIESGAEAYDGSIHIAFCDGHIEKQNKVNIPLNTTSSENRLFWKGIR